MEIHCFVNKEDAKLKIIILCSGIILKSTKNKSVLNTKTYGTVLSSLKHFLGQCERSFSQLKVVKTKYRSMLTNEHVKNCMIFGYTGD